MLTRDPLFRPVSPGPPHRNTGRNNKHREMSARFFDSCGVNGDGCWRKGSFFFAEIRTRFSRRSWFRWSYFARCCEKGNEEKNFFIFRQWNFLVLRGILRFCRSSGNIVGDDYLIFEDIRSTCESDWKRKE